jgi:hypothetical protein
MKIAKSSRHSKITGDFAERLVLYWLSKHGFECALVDHVGLDIIARNPHNEEVMGISVKSRSRNIGTDGTSLSIPNDNLLKLDGACQSFNCKPYFAIVVDEADSITAFILSKAHLVKILPPGREVISWKMRKANIAQYETDPEIRTFRFSTTTGNWWNEQT